MNSNKTYKNVFEAIEDDPVIAENLRIRSEMMVMLRKFIKENGLTQKQAAKQFHVTQPRISNLVRGKIDLFTIDMLVSMLSHAGIHVEFVTKQAA